MPRKPRAAAQEPQPEVTTELTDLTGREKKGRPKVPFETLCATAASLSPNEAPALYVYRLSPKINRKLTGKKPSYIERLIAPFPADLKAHIISRHGGGDYDIWLNCENRQDNQVCKGQLEVPAHEIEPILDPAELVRGGAAEEQLIQLWAQQGKIIIEGHMVRSAATGATPKDDGSETTGAYAQRRLIDLAVEKANEKQTSGLDLTGIAALAAALKPAGSSIEPLLLKMIEAQDRKMDLLQAQLLEMAKERRGAGNGAANSVDRLRETLELARELQEMSGSGTKKEWYEVLAEALPKAVAAFGLTQANGSMPSFLPSTTAAPAAENPEPAAPAAEQPRPQSQGEAQMHYLLGKAIEAIRRGRHGSDFADSIVDLFGQGYYDKLCLAGAETLKMALMSMPGADAALTGYNVDGFIEQFLEPDDEPEDEQPEETNTTA